MAYRSSACLPSRSRRRRSCRSTTGVFLPYSIAAFSRAFTSSAVSARIAWPTPPAERLGPAAVRALARQEVGHDGDEAVLRELVAERARPVAHAVDVVNHEHDAGLVLALGIDDPGLERAAVGQLDVHPFAVARGFLQRPRGVVGVAGGIASFQSSVMGAGWWRRRLHPEPSPARSRPRSGPSRKVSEPLQPPGNTGNWVIA